MTKRTPAELRKLTIKRLQALLKATRARYMERSSCKCGCGESYETIYGPKCQEVQLAKPYKTYYLSVKTELKRRQGSI